jgi:hypothetical protein
MSGTSNHFDSLTAVKAVVDGLALSGLTGGCVIQEVAEYQDGQNTLPFVSVSPYGPEKITDELNAVDGVHYGILVAIIAKPDVNSLETRLGWRQKMRRNFNNHDLAVNSGSYQCTVEPGNVIEPRIYYGRNGFVSGFVVRVWFQESRT